MSAFNISPRTLRIAALATAATVTAAAAPAFAQQSQSTMAVGAAVANSCVVSASALDLGSINTTTTGARDSTGNISVTCTNGAGWSAAADAGQGTGATPGARQMVNGSDVLNYALYSDSTRLVMWGDGTAGTTPITGTGTGSAQDTIIYASVLPGQTTARAGTYADQITVTLTY